MTTIVRVVKEPVIVRVGIPGPPGAMGNIADGDAIDDVATWDGNSWIPAPRAGLAITVFSHIPALVEVGEAVDAPAFTASYNFTPTGATLRDDQGSPDKDVSATPNTFESDESFSKSEFGAAVVFTLTASKGTLQTARTATITWGQKNFWGVGPAGQGDEAFIQALTGNVISTSRATSFTVTAGSAEKIYFAARTANGAPTFKDHATGFGIAISKVGDFDVTNAHGVTEQYQLWESDNVGLGTITVDVT